MKSLTIGEQLLLFTNKNARGKLVNNTLVACPKEGAAWLTPEELLQVRDWINERVRELVFQGWLPGETGLGD